MQRSKNDPRQQSFYYKFGRRCRTAAAAAAKATSHKLHNQRNNRQLKHQNCTDFWHDTTGPISLVCLVMDI